MIYAVIMAGGAGTRFWPKSTQKTPKQFLKLFGERTMIQNTVDRLSGFIPAERTVVFTNETYTDLVREQLPDIPDSFVIGEPVARNTAPCVAAASQMIYNMDPEAVVVVLPADHQVADEEAFRSLLAEAAQTAAEQESLVTIGIKPDRPETGYGYIRFEQPDSPLRGSSNPCRVVNFTEKPEYEKAIEFLESGDYLWNSGMFIWKAKTVLDAFKNHQTEMYNHLDHIKKKEVSREDINRFFRACPSISVDYGIMEKAENVQVLQGDFGWNDVGSWKAVHEIALKDSAGNSIQAALSSIQEASGNLVQCESGKLIALVGVENIALVETGKAILVCDLDKSQDVRKVVEHLKSVPQLSRFL